MKFFSKNKKELSFVVIIGCNKSGISLAESFLLQGIQTLIVDKSAKALKQVSPAYAGDLAMGDALDDQIIDGLAFQAAKVIIVVTASDNRNIFISQSIRNKVGGEKKIIARLNEASKASTYMALGIETFCIEELFANEVVGNLSIVMDGKQI